MDSFAHVKSSIPLNHTYYGPLHRDRLIAANKGKLAVVTGAGRGIGRAITVELANSGANVAVLDLGDTAETRAACEQFGVKALGFRCDVTDVARVREVLRDIERRLGPIDILVNNAGRNNKGRKVHEESFEESWSVVEACFKSTMICTYEVIKSMRKRGSGCIINIASRAALSDAPIDVPYCSAKAAIARATGCIQAQLEADGLGDQVQIYALHPGGVWTPMNSGMAEQVRDMLKPLLNDGPELCGATCAYLATGKAKALKGMLYDCRQDIERVTGVGRDTLVENRLYTLKMDYLQGYKDEV